jgi:hypothetical protein
MMYGDSVYSDNVELIAENAVAEERRQFGSPEEGERLPLEAVTRELVKIKLN